VAVRDEELHLWQVLVALEENSDRAQRSIAASTGMSLSKVNFCLKRLVDKGHVKLRNVARNPNKLGYLYVLTPEGMREKSRLTYHFVRRAAAEYNRVYSRVIDCLEHIAGKGSKAIVFYGTGDIAEVCYQALSNHGRLALAAVIDDARCGSQFHGTEVRSARWLREQGDGLPVLLCDADHLLRAREWFGEERLHVLG
jgi:MarR family transcriptional regulator, temperature-dependent positive regulator of motility